MLELPIGNSRPTEGQLADLKASIPVQPRLVSGLLVGNWLPQGPGAKAVPIDYSHAVSAVGLIAKATGVDYELIQAQIPGMHPGRAARVVVSGQEVGFVGELHPAVSKANYLPGAVAVFELNLDQLGALAPEVLQASELRVMTAATQDLSLVVSVEVSASSLAKVIAEGAGDLLESISLVDDYRGTGIEPGKKSLTFGLVFRAADRTLTQQEASQARDAAVALANQKFGAELRA